MPQHSSTTETMALTRAMQRWSLVHPEPVAETATSHVYRVTRPNRSPAALKLLKPEANGDEARGGALLAWYNGDGAAHVFGLAADATLMQWLDGGSLGDVARAGDDGKATKVLCDVVARLHMPREASPPELVPLRRRFAALFARRPSAWPPRGRDSVMRAIGLAHRLFDREVEAIPLHGDIHHDNILRAGEAWVAIDPKGLLGDPAYDYANSFLNPKHGDEWVVTAGRIARHSAILAERSGIARRHLLAWAVAHAALSAAWDLEDGNPVALQLDILPLLLAAYETA